MTFFSNWKFLAIGAVFLVLVSLGGYAYILKQKIASLEATQSVLHKTLVLLRQSMDAQYSELYKRQEESQILIMKRSEEDDRYEKLKNDESEVSDWSNSPIPKSIVQFLRENP